ncbi:DNA-binding SARP family transcriptional activator/WD40 repeat protein [Nocardioides sp. BE266]|uniref:nSTAND1 domain-containing NTPase n=1 Tax=Nocardioides sp. BE266 TaxID=2817725 RepID=UPI0028563C1E|nr:BTAD domain-containing putative transcriptional regulator [Nocardioides sp. BE266]MDR7253853.1 DNA-binding SARP family transcriptional activator/WD40 repeat protein [Nocardioides sp. BE266]
MGVTVLGPVTVDDEARLSPRDRLVLQVLALHLGRPVSADRLADAMWGDSPPASRTKILQGCVVRLRKELGAAAVLTSAQGYALHLSADEVDAARFEAQVDRARELLAIGEADRVAYLLTEALALWRGEPYAELEEWAPARAEVRRLQDVRLEAEELLVDARLRTGRHREVLARARTMVEAAPLRERRWALLALAQYQAGNQADALRTLHQLKTVLVQQLGIDPSPEVLDLEEAILRQDAGILGGATATPTRSTCPWQGLHAYDASDADRYFGRDHDIAACLAILARAPLLALVGPSGSGKSSLLRAGVGAALQSRGRVVRMITPGSHPVDALPRLENADDVLFVDQLEELFTSCEDPAERQQFVDAIVTEAGRRTVAVAIRADHLADVVAHPGLSRLVEQGLHLVGGLGEDGLREAIVAPARQFGLLVEPGLVDLLVHEVGDDPGALPLLSHALLETWKRREGNTLTVAGYRASGGIRDAVAQSAEQLYAKVQAGRRHELRDLVLRLVSPGSEGVPVRTRVPRRLVATDASHDELIEMLVGARLVTSDEGVLEITHEALTRAWPRLQAWLDDDVEGQRIRHHLTAAADAWDALGRPESELYRGVRLARAVDWRDHTTTTLTETESAFVDAGLLVAADEEREVRARARVQARLIRRLRVVLAGAVVLLVLALAAGGVAGLQTSHARSNAAAARAAQSSAEDNAIAAEARQAGIRAAATTDIDQSLLLAAAAVRLDDSPSELGNLAKALAQHPALISSVSLTAPDRVQALDVSPDGASVATIDDDHLVTVLDRASGATKTYQAGRTEAERNILRSVRYSPDGRILAVGRATGSSQPVTLLDPQTLRPLSHQLGGLPQARWAVADVTWSQDGRTVAVGLWRIARRKGDLEYGDALAAVWRVDQPGKPTLLDVAGSRVVTGDWGYVALALSPDGERLYVGPDARVYDVRTGKSHRFTDVQMGQPLGSVAVSPDGRLVVVTQDEGISVGDVTDSYGAVVVDARTGRTVRRISTDHFADDVRFSESGERLFLTDLSLGPRTAQIWDVSSGRLLATATLDGGDHRAVDLAPDGRTAISADWSGHVRTWDMFGARSYLQRVSFRGFLPDPCMATPSPDARFVVYAICSPDLTIDGSETFLDVGQRRAHFARHATSGWWVGNGGWDGPHYMHAVDGTISVFDGRDGRPERSAHPLGDWVVDVVYTPDRQHVVVAERSGRVSLLDASTFRKTGRPVELGMDPLLVSAGPDDTAFVVYGPSATSAYLKVPADRWALVDLRSGEIRLRGPIDVESPIWSAVTPDGRRGVVTGLSGQVQILDLTTGHPIRPPRRAHDASVYWAAFSPDGSRLVSNGEDGSVLLWDVDTAEVVASVQLPSPGADQDTNSSAEFTPDGRTVLIAPFLGHAVYVWDPSPERALEFACRMAGRDLTEAEWAENFPDQPYRETCPED